MFRVSDASECRFIALQPPSNCDDLVVNTESRTLVDKNTNFELEHSQ